MKLAIVDDEKTAVDLLKKYIKRFEEENKFDINVSVFYNPNDFLINYSNDYGLVLMDIEMPGLNGIETAKELRRIDNNVVLIFITNMMQYAINGYEVEAIDFVLKPLSYEDFVLKMQKALRYVSRNKDKKITINTQDSIINLYISDIYYIEVNKHYLLYHTTNGVYTTRGVMKNIAETLEEYNFVRSNHCYLINLKYIQSINGNIVRVSGKDLSISRNKKNELMMKFTKYIGGI